MTNSKNGKQDVPTLNAEQLKEWSKLEERRLDILHNAGVSRSAFFQQMMDPRRDLNKECGYPPDYRIIQPDFYRTLYDTEGIATRLVDVLPQECWQEQPEVLEDEDEDNETAFEAAWKDLSNHIGEKSWLEDDKQSTIWDHLRRADELAGIGRFGIMLLGFNDGCRLSEPVAGMDVDLATEQSTVSMGYDMDPSGKPVHSSPLALEGTDLQYQGVDFGITAAGSPKDGMRLIFIRSFDESLVQIVRFESNIMNPRYGQPTMYKVTFNDPRQTTVGVGLQQATLMVHWSRVIHIAERLTSSPVFGVPRMQPSLHRLLDLCKLYGGSAEMYWKGAFPGLSFETHPQLGGEVKVDADTIRAQMWEYQNDLQRFLLTTGMSAKTLATQVVDPTPQILTQIQALCIEKGIPQRIFMGSERGELASSQDDKAWGLRIKFRKVMYLTPRVIGQFINRLIQVKVLPEPEAGTYKVKWPGIDALTETEKATIALQLTQALASYVSAGIENVMTLQDYLTKILGMDSEIAEQIAESASELEAENSQTMYQYGPNDATEPEVDPNAVPPAKGAA